MAASPKQKTTLAAVGQWVGEDRKGKKGRRGGLLMRGSSGKGNKSTNREEKNNETKALNERHLRCGSATFFFLIIFNII